MACFGNYYLCFHILACLVTATIGTYYPETIYLSHWCRGEYDPWEDIRIKLTSDPFLPPNQTCSLTIKVVYGTRLIAQFLNYHMDERYTNEYGRCEYESLQLYNVYGKPQLPDTDGYCRMERPASVFDLGSTGRFVYTTYEKNLILAADVELLVSTVRDKRGSDCPSDYFDCYYNNYCISKSLTCNGYNDCGNNRDETVGCSLSGGVIAAIVVVVIIIFCCAAVATVCVFKHKMRRRYQRI